MKPHSFDSGGVCTVCGQKSESEAYREAWISFSYGEGVFADMFVPVVNYVEDCDEVIASRIMNS